nr:hypothetical protein [uncultured Peptostreptococcus sp.]
MIGKELEEFIKDEVKAFEERLRAKAEELREQMADKPKSIWDLDIRDREEYYYIFSDGDIGLDNFDNCFSEKRRDAGNAFLTEEEAEFERERRKIEAIMRRYARPFKHEEDNWYIECSHASKHIGIDALCEYDCGIIYFESEEIARDVIDEIGEDKLKKYWFRVTE